MCKVTYMGEIVDPVDRFISVDDGIFIVTASGRTFFIEKGEAEKLELFGLSNILYDIMRNRYAVEKTQGYSKEPIYRLIDLRGGVCHDG